MSWTARTKDELIIEVWEKLDCETVGAAEIESIETVVVSTFGQAAVDSPMVIARLLVDEGAELRHSEIMTLYVERQSDRPYDAALRNIVKLHNLGSAAASIKKLENLRRKYASENDKDGLKIIRQTGLHAKQTAVENTEKHDADKAIQQINAEIAQWFTVWLQTPTVFDDWLDLRQRSPDFIGKFGDAKK